MESLLLDKIDQPSDLKKLNAQQVEKTLRRDTAFYAGKYLQDRWPSGL